MALKSCNTVRVTKGWRKLVPSLWTSDGECSWTDPRWHPWHVVLLLQHSIMLRIFFIIECGIMRFLCTMHIFKVPASSSSHRLLLCQISFFPDLHCWASPRRRINQPISHSAHVLNRRLIQLIWCAGNWSALRNIFACWITCADLLVECYLDVPQLYRLLVMHQLPRTTQ